MNKELKKAIENYEKLIKDFADSSIKCFTEKIIPVE